MLQTENGFDTLLNDHVAAMLIADATEPYTTYMGCCITCEKEGLLELELPLIAVLEKAPSYALPPMLEEFVKAQSINEFCKQAAAIVGIPGFAVTYKQSGILVRKSAMDNVIKKVVAVTLQPIILYLAHHIS